MAMFGLKEVLDPLAQQLGESARQITDSLKNIEDAVVDLLGEQRRTNELLAEVVDNTDTPRKRAQKATTPKVEKLP